MEKGLNNYRYNKEKMRGKSGYIQLLLSLIITIILLGLLFLYPFSKTQIFVISISRLDKKVIIDYTDIEYLRKPVIDIFTKSNPKSNMRLDITILDGEGNHLINQEIKDVGFGESRFKIEGKLIGNFTLINDLYVGEDKIAYKKEEVELK